MQDTPTAADRGLLRATVHCQGQLSFLKTATDLELLRPEMTIGFLLRLRRILTLLALAATWQTF